MGGQLHTELKNTDVSRTPDRNLAPLFASPLMAFLILLRDNLSQDREQGDAKVLFQSLRSQ
jgi:hypothetical protein